MKGFFNGPCNIVHITNQIIVLGARTGNAGHIGFLKRIVAYQIRRHLTANTHKWGRLHIGIGDTGDRIRRPRP